MVQFYKGVKLPDESFEMQEALGGEKPKPKPKPKPKTKAKAKVKYSISDLSKMNKAGVMNVAEERGLEVEDKTKKELIEEILNS